jgi:hypothetical protein
MFLFLPSLLPGLSLFAVVLPLNVPAGESAVPNLDGDQGLNQGSLLCWLLNVLKAGSVPSAHTHTRKICSASRV